MRMHIVGFAMSSVLGIHGGDFEPFLNSKSCKQERFICLMMSSLGQALRLRSRPAHDSKSLIT
jgi:hypothetical protein